jgi:putative transposase
MPPLTYSGYRFPRDIIQRAVWMYLRFTLSYRDVEELLAERGIAVTYETVRRWVLKFGPAFARNLRRLRPRPTGKWHLDEIVVAIQGKRMYLWRAVDREGEVLDLLVQPKRDTAAALRLMRKLKKQGYAPDQIVTDKLGSYGAARRELGLSARHERGLRKRILISRYDGENGRCSGSSRRDQPSASCPPQHASDLPVRGDKRLADCDRCGLTEPTIRAVVTALRFP